MVDSINFLFVGVGGQGIILVSDVVADVGLKLGLDAKKSEIHGMSQRGGSVESHVRWGDKVYSPIPAKGEVNYLVAMEILEAGRWAPYLAPDGEAIINNQQIASLSVSSGLARYPETERIVNIFAQRTKNVHLVEGLATARRMGNPAVAGVVLLGYLSSMLQYDEAAWLEVIEKRVPARFVKLNKEAFVEGRHLRG
ncbi:MAG: indolepyruvate oxidoreductase subunit beta [Chloroflexi bacterium]|nr:indolepyruvate oxidoreductase subunit beta [Chloroflexota bacterium]